MSFISTTMNTPTTEAEMSGLHLLYLSILQLRGEIATNPRLAPLDTDLQPLELGARNAMVDALANYASESRETAYSNEQVPVMDCKLNTAEYGTLAELRQLENIWYSLDGLCELHLDNPRLDNETKTLLENMLEEVGRMGIEMRELVGEHNPHTNNNTIIFADDNQGQQVQEMNLDNIPAWEAEYITAVGDMIAHWIQNANVDDMGVDSINDQNNLLDYILPPPYSVEPPKPAPPAYPWDEIINAPKIDDTIDLGPPPPYPGNDWDLDSEDDEDDYE